MFAEELVVAGPHSLIVYQSDVREWRRTSAWIADALANGEKVFYKTQSTVRSARPAIGNLISVGGSLAALDSGQLEIIDATQCYVDTGGNHQALFEWHVALVEQARREGYARVAITGNGVALHAMTPDPQQLLAHERDLNRLTTDPGVRALCRYDLRTEQSGLLAQMAGAHYQSVDDACWASEQRIGKLVVRGEIDMSNAERFAAVLYAAAADGVRIVDLGDVTFMAVVGTAVLAQFAEFLHGHGDELVLTNVPPIVMRVLSVLDFAERVGVEIIPVESNGKRDSGAPNASGTANRWNN